MLLYVVIKH